MTLDDELPDELTFKQMQDLAEEGRAEYVGLSPDNALYAIIPGTGTYRLKKNRYEIISKEDRK